MTFFAPQSIRGDVKRWLDTNHASLSEAFARARKVLDAAFPFNVSRTFEVYLIPAGKTYEHRWTSIVFREQDVRLHFAFYLPATLTGDDRDWSARLFGFLSHEYSHSYFWFHPQWFRNNYSDEVIAWSIQRCVQTAIAGRQDETPQDGFAQAYANAKSMSPAAVFARYHAEYPETYAANIAAEGLFRRAVSAETAATTISGLPDLCRTIVSSGVDFTSAREDR